MTYVLRRQRKRGGRQAVSFDTDPDQSEPETSGAAAVSGKKRRHCCKEYIVNTFNYGDLDD